MPVAIGLQFSAGSLIPADAPSNAVIGIVGTSALGAINTPITVKNLTEAIAAFGYPTTGSTIPDALNRAYKSYGQITFVGVNVAAPAQIAVVAVEYTFNAQDRIQLPHRHITTPIVTNQAGTTTYVLNTDYTINLVMGLIQRKGSAIPANSIVKVGYSRPDFAAVTSAMVVGGVNVGTGKREGLDALIDAELVNLNAANITDIICPGYSQIQTVATKMAELATRLRSQYYLDAPASATVAEVLAGRTASAAPVAHFATQDERAILCYPNAIVSGVEEWLSNHVAFARAIATPEIAPTNLEFKGVTSWKTILLTSSSDDLADNAKLVNVGVVTYLSRPGQNPVLWGHFNASYPQVNVMFKNFDRIHIVRIRDMVIDAIELRLSSLVARSLGMRNPAAIAAIESLASQVANSVRGVEASKLIFLPLASDLALNKLAFRLEIRAANVLDLISFDFLFIAGV